MTLLVSSQWQIALSSFRVLGLHPPTHTHTHSQLPPSVKALSDFFSDAHLPSVTDTHGALLKSTPTICLAMQRDSTRCE